MSEVASDNIYEPKNKLLNQSHTPKEKLWKTSIPSADLIKYNDKMARDTVVIPPITIRTEINKAHSDDSLRLDLRKSCPSKNAK